jgi:hypothetical protein
MMPPTGIPAKIARLVTEAQGSIYKIAEAMAVLHDQTRGFEGRYMHDPTEGVWDRVAVALNEASGYGVVLNISVRKEVYSTAPPLLPSEASRVRLEIPARIYQHREKPGFPEKLLPNRLSVLKGGA